MGDKDNGTALIRASEADRRALAERMAGVHISRVREMPRIELYLDQVLTLVSQELDFMCVPGETLLTGSMVNNYVKQRVIAAPHKKRYTRRHLAALVFVCAFKRVFSIAQVKQLMDRVYASGFDLEELYDAACGLFERELTACFSDDDTYGALRDEQGLALEAQGDQDTELVWLVESSVAALVAKVYVEQTLLMDGGGER